MGGVLTVALMSPDNLMSVTGYHLVHNMHGAMGAALLPLFLLRVPRAAAMRHAPMWLGGGVVYSVGIVALNVPRLGHLAPSIGCALVGNGLSLLAVATFRARVGADASRVRAVGFLCVALVHMWAATAWDGLVLLPWEPIALGVALCASVAALVDDEGARNRMAVLSTGALAGGLTLASAFFDGLWRVFSATAVTLFVSAVLAPAPATNGKRITLRAGMICLGLFEAYAVVGWLVRFSSDVHSHDTLLVDGAAHAAFFAAALACSGAGPLDKLGARSGLITAALGAQVFVIAQLWMGSSGMPRRYANYLEQFTVPHGLATLGAIAVIVGSIILARSRFESQHERPTTF